MIKRILDIIFSLLGLIILSPIILVSALLVLVFLGRPVFFLQERPGYKGKLFRIIKFRTMLHSKDGDLGKDHLRMHPFGNFLRSLSIDELPELINILKGDMSIVGPRPLLKEYLPLYSKEQKIRHNVKPGLTGWAQINGRNAITWQEKFKLDKWYVENMSIMLDFKIIVITLLKVLKRENISSRDHVTVEKFNGYN